MNQKWIFTTLWCTEGELHGMVENKRSVIIEARDELTAMTRYCELVWVQGIDYKQFVSLTIRLDRSTEA